MPDAWRASGGRGHGAGAWHSDPDCRTLKGEAVPADPDRADLDPCAVCTGEVDQPASDDMSAYNALLEAADGD